MSPHPSPPHDHPPLRRERRNPDGLAAWKREVLTRAARHDN